MLNKILLTAVLIMAVWLGFKYWNKFVLGPYRQRQREMPRRRAPEARADEPPAADVEDMVACRVCGAYVPAKRTPRCGRPDCPF